jgi:hypothetical protein
MLIYDIFSVRAIGGGGVTTREQILRLVCYRLDLIATESYFAGCQWDCVTRYRTRAVPAPGGGAAGVVSNSTREVKDGQG